jgi:hypothetical protein
MGVAKKYYKAYDSEGDKSAISHPTQDKADDPRNLSS